jgi:pimeloyl-[acyl-carrier protein] synthase
MFDFNPLSPEFQANPYQYYHLLHEHMPMFHWEQWNMWFFSRYDDCVAVLKDNRFGHEYRSILTEEELAALPQIQADQKPLWDMQRDWLLLRNPPNHTRLKMLMHKAFTPRIIERLRSHIQEITDDLLDKVQDTGKMNVVEDLAFPLPITVIAELLGIPVSDRELLRDWSRPLAITLELIEDPEPYNLAAKTTVEITDYLQKLVNERRKQPKEDLISALVAAEEQGDKLTEAEMISNLILLIIAGHETTVNLISSGTLALLRHPAQLEILKNDPALVKNAVEEMLRYDSPVQITSRLAMQDLEFNGKQIRRGTQVATMLGAANRDPNVFPNPDAFDVTRANAAQHVGLGNGIHYCLGAPLARMEGEIAFSTLLRRLPKIALAEENPSYRETYVLRGVKELSVAF